MMDEGYRTYISQAIRHYSSLFTIPSYQVLIPSMLLLSVGGSITAFAIALRRWEALYAGLIFGLRVLALPTLLADIITGMTVTKGDPIFNLRRCIGLSLFVCASWVVITNIGGFFQSTLNLPQTLALASIFSVSSAISLRFFVLGSISFLSPRRIFLSTLIQPSLCLISAVSYWDLWSPNILLNAFISTAVLLIASQTFIHFINKQGEKAVGVGAVSLLRGFLSNWIAGLTTPLEDYFEKMGTYADIPVALLAFRGKRSPLALVVVPTFHPGPFKNLGSSNLPYTIQRSLEERVGGIVAVPHGTSGHELDLTSQAQCEKVLREVLRLAEFRDFSSRASRMVRRRKDSAKATCQIFGRCILVTATCAPRSSEDIPRKVGLSIAEAGERLGAGEVVVVDAHNSIGSAKEVPMFSEAELQRLQSVAEEAIKSVLNEEMMPFRVGAAKVVPPEFSLEEGMGPGGIVAIVVVVGGQTVAYVVVDGNNMVTGLRERILESLRGLGVEDAEVMTTDTHAVNALTLTERGYHPVGEAVDQESLVSHIREAVAQALDDVHDVEAAWRTGVVKNVRTIGEEKILGLSALIDSSLRLARWLALLIYVPATFIAVLLFFMTALL